MDSYRNYYEKNNTNINSLLQYVVSPVVPFYYYYYNINLPLHAKKSNDCRNKAIK